MKDFYRWSELVDEIITTRHITSAGGLVFVIKVIEILKFLIF